MKLHRNSKIFINYFIGPLLFIWLSWSIYQQIIRQPDLETAWQHIKDSFSSPLIWNMIVTVLLMFVNWSIEAWKWRLSIREIQQVSFGKAFQAVLSGVSFSVSTPNRVGEYLGRVLYMEEGNRLKTISITIVGSLSQLLITLLMGLIGLMVLRPVIIEKDVISPVWLNVIVYGVLAVLILLTLFYFRLAILVRWFDRIPATKRFRYLVVALEHFDAALLLKLLSLSLIRFSIFLIQYFLLFRLFNVQLDWWESTWAVSVSFLVMAIIPTITLLELVQRGKVVATLAGIFSVNTLGMNLATASIWFINLILPAVVGSLLILRMRKIVSLKNEND